MAGRALAHLLVRIGQLHAEVAVAASCYKAAKAAATSPAPTMTTATAMLARQT